jgi:hypothetical protein
VPGEAILGREDRGKGVNQVTDLISESDR